MEIPASLHPGSGGIPHNEKSLGIWGEDQKFSDKLQVLINEN